jgi:hypothetical protein
LLIDDIYIWYSNAEKQASQNLRKDGYRRCFTAKFRAESNKPNQKTKVHEWKLYKLRFLLYGLDVTHKNTQVIPIARHYNI